MSADGGAADATVAIDAAADAAAEDAAIDAAVSTTARRVSIARCVDCGLSGQMCVIYADDTYECIDQNATPLRPSTQACRVTPNSHRFRVGLTRATGATSEPASTPCEPWMDCLFSESGVASCATPPRAPAGLGESPWRRGESGLCEGCVDAPCHVYADGTYECNSFPSRSYGAIGSITVDYCTFEPVMGILSVGTCVDRGCPDGRMCATGDACGFVDGVASCERAE